MRLQAILVKHFQPAGVMGGGNPVELEHDLRRCARLNAILYGALLAILVAVLIGLGFAIWTRISLGTIVLGGGIIAGVFEGIRRTVRTWSQASLLAQLSRRLEGPQVQSVIETLIETHE